MLLENAVLFASVLISYFLQTSVGFFQLGGIKPDFVLLLTIYVAIYKGSFNGTWIGLLGGLLLDINLGGLISDSGIKLYYIGTYTFSTALVGYLTGKIAGGIDKEGNIIIALIVFILSLLKGFLTFFIVALFHGGVSAQSLISIIIPVSFYNSILSFIWMKLLRWAIPHLDEGKS